METNNWFMIIGIEEWVILKAYNGLSNNEAQKKKM